MSRLIYLFITLIVKLHDKLLAINDNTGLQLSDKQLHFLIIGLFGFGMICVIQPLFKWLSSKGYDILVSFLYVFTVVTVITFAIEIGQAFSGTGEMDFYDIASGILGFLVFFCIYFVCYVIYKHIKGQFIKKGE